jgi:catechol 2,3-dioxygenase-like lactoylglutathione lyase family enzyme
MKTRRLDHIDLRVKDLKKAREFYGKILPPLGFTCDRSDADWGTFYSVGPDKPSDFFGFTVDPDHQPNGTRIAFWAETRQEVDDFAKIVRQPVPGIWKARKSARAIVPGTTPCSSRIPRGTNWKSAVESSQ